MFDLPIPHMAPRSVQRLAMPRSADQFWPIFRNIIEARARLGLSRPVLTTLRAMITFMERGTVVFASNRRICERAEGISPSSLRRHIKALCDAGLARRTDSPNGKRYCLRTEGMEDLIFGVDLSPLLQRAEDIETMVTETRDAERRTRHLRTQLGSLIWQAEQEGLDHETLHACRLNLRRKLDPEALQILVDDLSKTVENLISTDRMTARHHQNDWQIQKTNTDILVSVSNRSQSAESDLTPDQIEKIARELAPEALEMIRSTQVTSNAACNEILGSWTGISLLTIATAARNAGTGLTMLSLLLIVQNIQRIKNPAAYLTATTSGNRYHQFRSSIYRRLKPAI